MAITQALPNSFKKQLLDGDQDFSTLGAGGDKFKLALYVSTATLSAATTSYTASGEVSSSGTNYTTGGKALVNSGTSVVCHTFSAFGREIRLPVSGSFTMRTLFQTSRPT